MRKPKDFGEGVWTDDNGTFLVSTYCADNKDIAKLIKWLEKVQKYNEFKNKKKKVKK
jgi:hypothetical protein